MTSTLVNISSKYALKNIFSYLSYDLRFKLAYGSKKLLKNLDISIKTFKKLYEIKKLISPSSYDIQKLIDYLNLENNDDDNENMIYGCLNSSLFNVDLCLEDENWPKIIKYINKIKLIITPNLLNCIYSLNNESNQSIFYLLNLYRNNIVEISFNNFINESKIKFETINQIISFLQSIYSQKSYINTASSNSISHHNHNAYKDNNYEINENCKVKKITFENNEILPYIDVSTKFLDKIDEIIPLNEINQLSLDANSFNEFQFTNIMKYVSKKIPSLNELNIINFGYKKSHYADLSYLLSNANECIQNIDLTHSLCSTDILPILNEKNFPLKVLKLKLYSNESEIKWRFLENSINNLEIFDIEIEEMNNHDNIEKIIKVLNKMQKLKKLKIIGGISPKELFDFTNVKNIGHLNVDLNLLYNNIEVFPTDLSNYFSNYTNLRTLILKSNDSFNITKAQKYSFEFLFSPKLKHITLINFDDNIIIPLLTNNKNNIINIEEFILDKCHFTHENYSLLVSLFPNFKSLLKLSLNNIDFKSSYKSIMEDISFYDYIPMIIKNIPSIIELDISNNKYDEKILNNKIFEKISSSMNKRVFCIKIFNREISITSKTFNYLNGLFGNKLYCDNNIPVINDKIIIPNDNDEDDNSFYENYNSDYSDYEFNQ